MSDFLQLVDVSARDGLQNELNAATLSAADKVTFIEMLARTGLLRIEAGSFVKPSAVPAMANTAEVAALLAPVAAKHPEVIFSYLVPNLKGLERAKEAKAGEVAIFLALSETFSRANINQGVDESFTAIAPVIAAAREMGMRVRGYISNVFGYSDYAFSPKDAAARSKQLLEMGCFEVSLGDTTAVGTPQRVEALMDALAMEKMPLEKIAMHFHDTFGRAVSNVETAYRLGIRTFDAAAGGLGGCPYANSPKGNVSMEAVVDWCAHKSIPCTVKDRAALAAASAFMLGKLGKA